MARNPHKDPSITQSNKKQDFSTRNGKGRKASRQSNSIDRQILKRDLQRRSEGA